MNANDLRIEVYGEPDEEYRLMKKISDACEEAEIDRPPEVEKYFNHRFPDPAGKLLMTETEEDKAKREGRYCPISEFKGDMQDGYEIDLTELPEGAKTLRVFLSY